MRMAGVERTGTGALRALALAGALLLAAAGAHGQGRHGASLGGEPKYGPDFSHYDYANPDAPKGGSLTLASPFDFDTLNPYVLKGRSAPFVSTLLFDTLTDQSLDEPFSEYGLIAESFSIADDALSVTFNLHPDARFSDGEPVTAEDVIFSFEALRSPQAAPLFRFYYADVAKAEAVNQHTARFTFKRQNRELAMILGQLPVLPEHFYSQGSFGEDFASKALGSGPYAIEGYEIGKFIRYKRREDYWGADVPVNRGRWNFDRVEVKFYRDPTVQLEGLKAGEFDFLFVNNSKQWAVDVGGEKWERNWIRKESLPHSNTSGMQGYVFNTRRAIFQERKVRQALALAFDFEWSNKNLFYGQYTQHDSYYDNSELAATGLPGEDELALLEPLREHLPEAVFTEPIGEPAVEGDIRRRLRAAKQMLNEAGWRVQDGVLTHTESGREMRFTVTLAQPGFQRITEPYLNNLAKLGVQAEMKTVDTAVYEQLVRNFDYDMIVGSFPQSQSPGNEQREFWHSETATVSGSRNTPGVSNPAVDALVGEIVAAGSRDALLTATHALDRVLWHMHYVVPHWYIDEHRVTYWNKFGRPETLPRYYQPTSWLFYWWVDPQRAEALQQARAEGRALELP